MRNMDDPAKDLIIYTVIKKTNTPEKVAKIKKKKKNDQQHT